MVRVMGDIQPDMLQRMMEGVMLDDGVRDLGVEERVQVKDLAVLLDEQAHGDEK